MIDHRISWLQHGTGSHRRLRGKLKENSRVSICFQHIFLFLSFPAFHQFSFISFYDFTRFLFLFFYVVFLYFTMFISCFPLAIFLTFFFCFVCLFSRFSLVFFLFFSGFHRFYTKQDVSSHAPWLAHLALCLTLGFPRSRYKPDIEARNSNPCTNPVHTQGILFASWLSQNSLVDTCIKRSINKKWIICDTKKQYRKNTFVVVYNFFGMVQYIKIHSPSL